VDLTCHLQDANGIASKITKRLDDDAKVIWGSRIQDDYKDKVRVMAIMTGVESSNIIGRDDNTQNTNSTSSQNSDNFTTDRSRKTSPDIDSIK
jgi:Cell division GTPase